MPAESKAQQHLFGMVHAEQKGELKHPSAKVKAIAREISPSSARHFAETRTKGLPEKKAELPPYANTRFATTPTRSQLSGMFDFARKFPGWSPAATGKVQPSGQVLMSPEPPAIQKAGSWWDGNYAQQQGIVDRALAIQRAMVADIQAQQLAAAAKARDTARKLIPRIQGLVGAGTGSILGGVLGAGIGGVTGAVDPGTDDHGKPQTRLRAALTKALRWGGTGSLLGTAAGGVHGFMTGQAQVPLIIPPEPEKIGSFWVELGKTAANNAFPSPEPPATQKAGSFWAAFGEKMGAAGPAATQPTLNTPLGIIPPNFIRAVPPPILRTPPEFLTPPNRVPPVVDGSKFQRSGNAMGTMSGLALGGPVGAAAGGLIGSGVGDMGDYINEELRRSAMQPQPAYQERPARVGQPSGFAHPPTDAERQDLYNTVRDNPHDLVSTMHWMHGGNGPNATNFFHAGAPYLPPPATQKAGSFWAAFGEKMGSVTFDDSDLDGYPLPGPSRFEQPATDAERQAVFDRVRKDPKSLQTEGYTLLKDYGLTGYTGHNFYNIRMPNPSVAQTRPSVTSPSTQANPSVTSPSTQANTPVAQTRPSVTSPSTQANTPVAQTRPSVDSPSTQANPPVSDPAAGGGLSGRFAAGRDRLMSAIYHHPYVSGALAAGIPLAAILAYMASRRREDKEKTAGLDPVELGRQLSRQAPYSTATPETQAKVRDLLPAVTGLLGGGVGGGLGGLAGAGLGGVVGAIRDPGDDEQGKRRSRLRTILHDVLVGGGLGVAGGGAYGGYQGYTGGKAVASGLGKTAAMYPTEMTAYLDRLVHDTGYGSLSPEQRLLARKLLPSLGGAGVGLLTGGAFGLAGAGVGGLTGAIRPTDTDAQGHKRSRLRTILHDALLGGGLGLAGGSIGGGLVGYNEGGNLADMLGSKTGSARALGYKKACVARLRYLVKRAADDDSSYLGRWLGLHGLQGQSMIDRPVRGSAVASGLFGAQLAGNAIVPPAGGSLANTLGGGAILNRITVGKGDEAEGRLNALVEGARQRKGHFGASFGHGFSKLVGPSAALGGLAGGLAGGLVTPYRVSSFGFNYPANVSPLERLGLILSGGLGGAALGGLAGGLGGGLAGALNETILSRLSPKSQALITKHLSRNPSLTGLPLGSIIGAGVAHPEHKQKKAASARRMKRADLHSIMSDPLTQAMLVGGGIGGGYGALAGGGIGAGIGGLSGALDPGKDAKGEQRSRLRAAVRAALKGGGIGALAGGGLGASVGAGAMAPVGWVARAVQNMEDQPSR